MANTGLFGTVLRACHDRFVDGEIRFRADLFRGIADYYDEFRPPYPATLLDDLRARVPIDGTTRLLDLACGTGQIAFALAAHVADIWAIDQEPDMVEFGRRKAERLGVTNIHFVAATAEEVELAGQFRLVAIGNAFHRLRRSLVVSRLISHLAHGSCIALLWGDTPWRGDQPWQRALDATLEQWMDRLGARDRLPAGWEEAMEKDPSEQILRRAGLSYEGPFGFSTVARWSTDSLIGLVYSTSFLSRPFVADHADEFERDMREQLSKSAPDGVLEHEQTFVYELGRLSL